MKIYQEELKRRLKEQGYGAVYDEQAGMLKIYQNGVFLCDQDKNGDLHFTRDAYALQNFHEISTPIAKDAVSVKDCVSLYEKGEPMKVESVSNYHKFDAGIAMDGKDSVNAKNGRYFIYKKSGNPNEEVAYFTEERLNEVIAEYAKTSVKRYYYFEKEPALNADGEDLYAYSKDRTILTSEITLGENIICLLDGEPLIAENLQHGLHTLTVCDEWGNSCDYELKLIRNTPKIYYKVDGGNLNAFSLDRVYYFKEAITLSIADEYDEMAMFQVYDMQGDLLGTVSIGETFYVSESGKYTVLAINHAGKSKTLEILISLNEPTITFMENTEENTLEIVVMPSEDRGGEIRGLEIYRLSGDGETWEVLEQDDNGTFISTDIHSYSFTTTGQYKVVVTDLYRTGFDAVEKEFSFTEKVEEITEEETKDTPAPMNTDEKQGGINGFVIALIIFGAVVIIGGVMVIIFNRKRGI